MSYAWHDLLGNLGVAMVLWCYLLLQLQRLDIKALPYREGAHHVLDEFLEVKYMCMGGLDR